MTDKPKITDFNEAKKRVGAQKKDNSRLNGGSKDGLQGRQEAAYDAALRKQRGQKGQFIGSGGIRWYHYLQLFLMLGLVALLMKACTI